MNGNTEAKDRQCILFEGRPTRTSVWVKRLSAHGEAHRERRSSRWSAAPALRRSRPQFSRVPSERLVALLPLRDGTAEPRLGGGSFGMIRELLALAAIQVATDTVRPFLSRGGRRTTHCDEASAKAAKTSDASASKSSRFSGFAAAVRRSTRSSAFSEPPRTRGLPVARSAHSLTCQLTRLCPGH